MNYKGYLAKIEFDTEDRIFAGRIIKIRDVVGFHSESAAELEEAFHEAVDNYLAACGKSIALKPAEKSFRQGWEEAVNGETMPIDELWTDYLFPNKHHCAIPSAAPHPKIPESPPQSAQKH